MLFAHWHNIEKFLSGSFPGQSNGGWIKKGSKGHSLRSRVPKTEAKGRGEERVGFLGRGSEPHPQQLGVDDFSLFWPLKKAFT